MSKSAATLDEKPLSIACVTSMLSTRAYTVAHHVSRQCSIYVPARTRPEHYFPEGRVFRYGTEQ